MVSFHPTVKTQGLQEAFLKCQGRWLIFVSKILSGKQHIEGLLTKLWLGLISNYSQAGASSRMCGSCHSPGCACGSHFGWMSSRVSFRSKGGCPESRTKAGVLPGSKSSWWCNFIQHINTAFSSWIFLFVRIANLGSIITKIRLWCIVSFCQIFNSNPNKWLGSEVHRTWVKTPILRGKKFLGFYFCHNSWATKLVCLIFR